MGGVDGLSFEEYRYLHMRPDPSVDGCSNTLLHHFIWWLKFTPITHFKVEVPAYDCYLVDTNNDKYKPWVGLGFKLRLWGSKEWILAENGWKKLCFFSLKGKVFYHGNQLIFLDEDLNRSEFRLGDDYDKSKLEAMLGDIYS